MVFYTWAQGGGNLPSCPDILTVEMFEQLKKGPIDVERGSLSLPKLGCIPGDLKGYQIMLTKITPSEESHKWYAYYQATKRKWTKKSRFNFILRISLFQPSNEIKEEGYKREDVNLKLWILLVEIQNLRSPHKGRQAAPLNEQVYQLEQEVRAANTLVARAKEISEIPKKFLVNIDTFLENSGKSFDLIDSSYWVATLLKDLRGISQWLRIVKEEAKMPI